MPRRVVLLLYATLAIGALMLTNQRPVNAANPAADLDQCRNGDQLAPVACTGAAWVNGNAGASNAHWNEGESIAYRMRFSSLTAGQHVLVIEWDTTQGGKHAIDYLTSVDRTEKTANPCSGVANCSLTTTAAIPADPNVTNAGLTQATGTGRWDQVFKLYNAGLSGAVTQIASTDYFLSGTYSGNSSTRLTITFTTSTPNPVLAWGGHIATRQDWTVNNSAIAISGSPYHMRLVALDGSGGNQDRSLSSAAAIFPASLTIIKDVLSVSGDNNAISSDQFDFTSSSPMLNNSPEVAPQFSLVDDGTPQQGSDATPAQRTYSIGLFGSSNAVTVTEGPYAQYTQGLSCLEQAGGLQNSANTTVNVGTRTANIVAEEGEIITCTYTNKVKSAQLTVIKHVVKDNGGAADASSFMMHVKVKNGSEIGTGQAGSETGTVYNLEAGTYVVYEDTSAGYTQTGISGACAADGSVTLVAGDNKSCTITNDDRAAHLKLVKTVTNDNGGTAASTAFTLSAAGPTPISGAGGAESDVNAGSYTLSETNVTGYTAGSWSCVGGTFTAPNTIQLALGQTANCTINNNDQSAHLKLVKTVTNDNGGTAKASDFTLSAAGLTPISGAGGAESDVSAGTYTLSETNVTGYTAGNWSCVGGTFTAPNSVQLALGQSATCTIINNDQTAHLKLVKTVTNDNGGTAVATDFTLSVAGPTPLSGAGGTEGDVNAGTYTLSETTLAGYTAGAWSCTGGTFTAPDKIAVALGQSATCTIDNNDKTAHLKLVKTVTNNSGGSAATTDFTLSAAGLTPISGAGGTESDVKAGSYTLSETNLPGYTAGNWSCVGGTQNGASVTLALGETATCTINNDDQQAYLTLVKTVVNNNGGMKQAADFPAFIDTTQVTWSTQIPVTPRSHTASETSQAGYTASVWGTDCAANGSVTIALGQSKTCTITNDDVAQTNGSSTAQSTVLHDSASITNIRPAGGTIYKVTFRLYKNVSELTPTCNDDTRVFTATRDLTLASASDPALRNGSASTTGAPSANTTDVGNNIVTASGKYYWTVQMASDVNNVGVAEECGREMTILTIDNNHTN
jgi:hypothetical protein